MNLYPAIDLFKGTLEDLPEIAGIYSVTCKAVENEVYIGQSQNIRTRALQHRYRTKGNWISETAKRFKRDGFVFQLEKPCEPDKLLQFEQIVSQSYHNMGYTVCNRDFLLGTSHPQDMSEAQDEFIAKTVNVDRAKLLKQFALIIHLDDLISKLTQTIFYLDEIGPLAEMMASGQAAAYGKYQERIIKSICKQIDLEDMTINQVRHFHQLLKHDN